MSLLESVAGLLSRTYRMRPGLTEIAPFVIGDRGYRALYASRAVTQSAASATGAGARTLVREMCGRVHACIYFPDAMIQQLETHPPQYGLGEENLGAFSTFVEEIDHLLVIAECERMGRSASLFELELHANVSKHLVLTRFLAGRAPRLDPARRIWLRRRLFDGGRYCDKDPQVRRRYEDAARWAVRMLDALLRLSAAECIDTLRRFHATNAAGKLELIGRLA